MNTKMRISKNDPSEFYYFILGSLSGLIMVMDQQSKFIFANRYTSQILGFSNEDNMLGYTPYDTRCPAVQSADAFIQQNNNVIQTQTGLTMLDIHRYADGETKVLLTKKNPLYVHDELVGVICHCTEIKANTLAVISASLIQGDKRYYANQLTQDRSYTVGKSLQESLLTKREMDCLFYFLRGQSKKQIGRSLKISDRTVETHIENIKQKWGCSNKSELIDRALAEGLLNYIPQSILADDCSYILLS